MLISVIDDEQDIIELCKIHLQKANFKVNEFNLANDFLRSLSKNIPDLIILDLMLPDADGMDVCKLLKSNPNYSHIPIIMLTARTDEIDRVLGFELGADDYVTKPFSPRELTARVKAILKRKSDNTKVIRVKDTIEIDLNKFIVKIEGKEVNLTNTELKILTMLCERPGFVFSRDQILDYLWGNEKIVVDRTIDVHIKHLREKIGKYGKYIKNIRGVGYKIDI